MSHWDDAEELFDEGDFAAARDAYRAHCLEEAPETRELFNLRLAEEQEALSFRRKLTARHPESISAQLELGLMLSHHRATGPAFMLLGELLSRPSIPPVERFRLHRSRLTVALARGEYETAADDFCFLHGEVARTWKARAIARFERSSARIIASLADSRARSFIDALNARLPKPHRFEELLARKAAELETLKAFEHVG